MKINQILLTPILTEKATNLAKNNIYAFKVNKAVNKYQIKEVLEELYNVKVDKVMIKIQKGKVKNLGRKRIKKILSTEKIAYVKLASGNLDLFPKA